MNVDPIKNGIVIDHIQAGKGKEVYDFLQLDELECTVALIKNVPSKKMGKKDKIKIDADIKLDLDVLGYVAPQVTVSTNKNGVAKDKRKLEPPTVLKNVIKCKNPRCITSVEQGIEHVFKLVDKDQKIYRCIYCESKAND